MQQNNISNRRRLVGIAAFALAGFLVLTAFILFLNTPTGSSLALVHSASKPPTPASICKTPLHNAGENTITLSSSGVSRNFLVHLAPSYGQQPQPLVINYHGYGMNSHSMEKTSNMDPVANSAGFIVVYPQAFDTPPSWNAGVGAFGPTDTADDVQFSRDMLSYLKTNYCVDSQRVYVTGFSLGGGMAYRIACDLSDQIAAVATVSGAYYPMPEGCPATHPMPVLEIHSVVDPLAPYDGYPARKMAAAQDYLNGWLTFDKCTQTSDPFFQKGDATGIEWTHCAPGVIVQHYRISDGQHAWFRPPTYSIDASVVVWQFFRQFSYPPSTPTNTR